MNKIPLIVVVGPTATGKTRLSIELAKIKNGEIVNADSMQIYKKLNIGTAKPTISEMQDIKHHMIGINDVLEEFSVAQYCKISHRIIKDIYNSGKLSFLVGGTGLYIDSLVNNIKFCDDNYDEDLRKELNLKFKRYGIGELLSELSKFDPVSAERMKEGNPKRIIRAIEIYKQTGITMSQHIENSKLEPSPYETCFIGLNYRDRNLLYDKINLRVDKMLNDGLIKEAEWLLEVKNNHPDKFITAMNAIGYKEIFPYLKGECNLYKAVEDLKKASRHYAKRQLTWFKRNEKINWLFIDDYLDFNKLINAAVKIINENKSEKNEKIIC